MIKARQSTTGGLPSAVKPTTPSSGFPRRSGWFQAVMVVIGSVTAAVLGTALHGQVISTSVGAVPAGAIGALLLAASIGIFLGTWFRSIWPTAGSGVLTYMLTGLMATEGGTSSLIVTGYAGMAMTPMGVAGNIWIFGQTVAVILAVVIVVRVMKAKRTKT